MNKLSIVVTFALLVLSFSGTLAADPPPETNLPQVQLETSAPVLEAGGEVGPQEEVVLPEGSQDLRFLSQCDPPACSGPYAHQSCYQWSLSCCHPAGSGICLCSQWTIVNGKFQCASGVCDCP